MPSMIGSKEIGGGYVRRIFTDNGERLKVGSRLSVERLKSWPNFRELERIGFIATYPPPPDGAQKSGERFALHEGFGRYSVIEGRKLNEHPLTKEEAEKLAEEASSPL